MVPAELVKARVIDIRDPDAPLPKIAVSDANVLYIINYDFSALAAGIRTPPFYQTRFYPAWWKRAIGAGVTLCTPANCLAELAHIIERTELENLWRTDPSPPELDPRNPDQDFNPRYTKTVRYHYHEQLRNVRDDIQTTLQSIQKSVNVLPQVGHDLNAFGQAVQQWVSSAADFGDALLVVAAKRAGIPHIVSDDADLVTFDGITLYTANRNAIDSAKQRPVSS